MKTKEPRTQQTSHWEGCGENGSAANLPRDGSGRDKEGSLELIVIVIV